MAQESLTPKTFKNIIDIVERRAGIAGTAQPRDRIFVQDAINEINQTISTERSWRWRKKDRSITFKLPVEDGTVDATNGSRIIEMNGLVVSDKYLGRSIRINQTRELYRIIGINVAANKFFLESEYVGATVLAAPYKLFKYEFALPPDLDGIIMVYVDDGFNYSESSSGELEDMNVIDFNRMLSVRSDMNGPPSFYTRDGKIFLNDLPPLAEMVLHFDFLGGDRFTEVSRLRVFPIAPDRMTMLHLNYTLIVPALRDDADEPLMPVDDRWVLVHGALNEWHLKNNSGAMAEREEKKMKEKLAEMRQEFHKTDVAPRFVVDATRYRRVRNLDNRKFIHLISRVGESS